MTIFAHAFDTVKTEGIGSGRYAVPTAPRTLSPSSESVQSRANERECIVKILKHTKGD